MAWISTWYGNCSGLDLLNLQWAQPSPSLPSIMLLCIRKTGRIVTDVCHTSHSLFHPQPLGKDTGAWKSSTPFLKNNFFHAIILMLPCTLACNATSLLFCYCFNELITSDCTTTLHHSAALLLPLYSFLYLLLLYIVNSVSSMWARYFIAPTWQGNKLIRAWNNRSFSQSLFGAKHCIMF